MAKSSIGGLNTETLMIERLLACPDLMSICVPISKPSYFVPELQGAVEFILEYYQKYNVVPDIDSINAVNGTKLKIPDVVLTDQRQFLLDQFSEFCKQEAVIEVVLGSAEFIDSGDYGSILKQLEEALLISIDRDLGTNPFEGVAERIELRNAENYPLPTGLDSLDRTMNGGLPRTGLVMISGGSGSGKSVLMTNIGLSTFEQGFNVLYVSLELQEDLVSERVEKMITGFNKADSYKRVNEVAQRVESHFERDRGKFTIKYMDSGSNANHIKAYLKEYEAQHKCVPDLLICDYLDLMNPNQMTSGLSGNVFERDKLAATELRSIGNNPHYNMAMLTASQQNRSAVDETDHNHSHIAGGLSKINTVDYYFSIVRTQSMVAEGLLELICLKARSSDAVGSRSRYNFDGDFLRISDMSGGHPQHTTPTNAMRENQPSEPKTQNEERFGDLADLFDEL